MTRAVRCNGISALKRAHSVLKNAVEKNGGDEVWGLRKSREAKAYFINSLRKNGSQANKDRRPGQRHKVINPRQHTLVSRDGTWQRDEEARGRGT